MDPDRSLWRRSADQIVLVIGDQRRELTFATHESRSLSVTKPPFRPAWGYSGESWYVITPAELRALAVAPPDSIELVTDGRTLPYIVLNRAHAALRDFIRDIPDDE